MAGAIGIDTFEKPARNIGSIIHITRLCGLRGQHGSNFNSSQNMSPDEHHISAVIIVIGYLLYAYYSKEHRRIADERESNEIK
jgi:hypothetical protein